MPRADRLLDLLQTLRRYRHPVSAAVLAEAMGVSVRTLYRDIAALQARGARIEGAPGVGYQLQPGFMLPPLMFAPEEIEALVLGSRWVAARADAQLAAAAREALAKISAVLPAQLRHELAHTALLVGPGGPKLASPGPTSPNPTSPNPTSPNPSGSNPSGPNASGVTATPWAVQLRAAIRAEHQLAIGYQDAQGRVTQRVIWPFALGFFEQMQIVVAWCALRAEIRHFRTDRITTLADTGERYPQRRQALLKQWRQQEGIADEA